MDLRTYLTVLRKRWLVIALLAAVGGGAAFAYAKSMPPSYRATAKVWVSLDRGETVSELVQGTAYAQSVVRSYAQLVSMPVVLDPVVAELGLPTTGRQLARSVTATTPLDSSIIEISASRGSAQGAADIANAVAAQLAITVDELSTTGSADDVVLRVVAPAVPATFAYSPNTRLTTATGILLGAAAGMALALVLAVLDTRVRSAQDVRRVTDAAVLGTVPFVRGTGTTKVAAALADPHGTRAEAYRRLRTNLRFLDASGPIRSLVVVSAVPGEGKSSTALNLAIAVAERDQRVLLVDADLRRPSIADYTGIEGSAGLTTALIGRASLEDLAQQWGVPGLAVLASGEVPPNPSQLIDSPAMAAFLERARESYDLVVIDAPPLLPVADGAVLARMTDGAVLVVGTRRVRRHELSEALHALDAVGATCLGVVVNAVPMSRNETSYRYAPETSRHRRQWTSRAAHSPSADDGVRDLDPVGRVTADDPAAASAPVRTVWRPHARAERHEHTAPGRGSSSSIAQGL